MTNSQGLPLQGAQLLAQLREPALGCNRRIVELGVLLLRLADETRGCVRFDDLEPEKRPASSDPSFARLWRETGDEEGIIQRTIKRWRGHGR